MNRRAENVKLQQEQTPQLLKNMTQDTKNSIAQLLLDDILFVATTEVAFEMHQLHKESSAYCQLCKNKCRSFHQKSGFDIYGHAKDSNLEKYECANCKISFPAIRFAPHLEKCLGLGRTSRSTYRKATTLIEKINTIIPDDDEILDKKSKKKGTVTSTAASVSKKRKPMRDTDEEIWVDAPEFSQDLDYTNGGQLDLFMMTTPTN